MVFIDKISLETVEALRRKKRRLNLAGFLFIPLSWILYFTLYGIHEALNSLLMLLALASLPAAIVLLILNQKSFLKEYKERMVRPNMQVLFEGFQYFPERYVDQEDFKASGLFRRFNRYQGDDYMEGRIGGIPMALSDLVVTYKSSSSSSTSSSSSVTIFQGLFLKAELPEPVSSPIWIRPRLKEEKIPRILRFFFKEDINPPMQITTGVKIFDEEFTLCSENPVAALNLFQVRKVDAFLKLGEMVQQYSKKAGPYSGEYPLLISVSGKTLYLAAWGIRLFNPRFSRPMEKDAKQLEASLGILQSATGWIRELLNPKE